MCQLGLAVDNVDGVKAEVEATREPEELSQLP